MSQQTRPADILTQSSDLLTTASCHGRKHATIDHSARRLVRRAIARASTSAHQPGTPPQVPIPIHPDRALVNRQLMQHEGHRQHRHVVAL